MSNLSLATLLCLVATTVTMANPAGRIVGGKEAAVGQFPYQVSLRYLDDHVCGGSIISRSYILTAAHCVSDQDETGAYHADDPMHYTILAGTNNRFNDGVVVQVEKIVMHENYGNFANDVAVLKLNTPLIFSAKVKAIPLASAEVAAGAGVIVSGWGRVSTDGNMPKTLLYNTLVAMTKLKCNTYTELSDTVICLAHKSGNGVCTGDSGGPAIYKGKLVGVAGFVLGGCGSSNPDGFLMVIHFVDWIKKHANL